MTSFQIASLYKPTIHSTGYICKQSGHRAVNFLNANVDAVPIFPPWQSINELMQTNEIEKYDDTTIANNDAHEMTKAPKRQAPASTASTSSLESASKLLSEAQSIVAGEPTDLRKPSHKKSKTAENHQDKKMLKVNANASKVGKLLAPALDKLTDSYIITFERFQEFIEKSYSTSDILSLSLEYTNYILSLINIIEETYPHVDTSLKKRSLASKRS